MNSFTVEGARVLCPASGRDEVVPVTVESGVVARIGGRSSGTVVDGAGHLLIPGLIDMRVSTGEPGQENRETVASAARAAARGGVTTVVLQPDTSPVVDDPSMVEFVRNRGRGADARVLVAGALTKGLRGEELVEMGLLRAAGAAMFTSGPEPVVDARLLRRVLQYSRAFGTLVANRCETPSLVAVAHESALSSRLGLAGEPAVGEEIAAARDIALARDTGARVLLDMVSSAEVLGHITRAKAQGVPVHASVGVNHLALNEVDIGDYRTFAKLRPPLRGENDRRALLAAVVDGTVDVVVSDHDPRPAGAKRRPYAEAAAGAVGLELLLSIALTLSANGDAEFADILPAMTSRPADLLGLPHGRIVEGAPADLVLVDADAPWVCDSDRLESLSNNTPFDGRRLTGRAVRTWVGGREVWRRT